MINKVDKQMTQDGCNSELEANGVPRNPRIYGYKPWRKNRGIDNRVSRDLSAKQFINLYSAVAFANSKGYILDVRVSIVWKLLGFTQHKEAAYAFQYGFIKQLRLWLNKKNETGTIKYELNYVYVHEVGLKNGFHTHLLIGIPPNLRKEFKKWVKNRLTDLLLIDKIDKIDDVDDVDNLKKAFHITCPPSDPIYRQWIGFNYMCKGLDKKAKIIAKVGEEPYIKAIDLIRFRYENPGKVLCEKNCGMSSNLNAEKRKHDEYKSPLERGITDKRILYTWVDYLAWLRKSGELENLNPAGQSRKKLEADESVVLDINAEDKKNKRFDTKMRRLNKRVLNGDKMAQNIIDYELEKKRIKNEKQALKDFINLDF